MERDFKTYKKWELFYKEMQEKEFKQRKSKAFRIANECIDEKGKISLLSIANKMKFIFAKGGLIQYGNCNKFQKPVSFIPNVCQLETQECFQHRDKKEIKVY